MKTKNITLLYQVDWLQNKNLAHFSRINLVFFFSQAVTVRSSVCLIHSYTSLCIRTTCWPHWDPTYRNTCGGRSIWPRCKCCSSWPSWYTLSNCYSSTATTRKRSSGGSACTPSCSSSYSKNSTNNNTRNRQSKR